MKKKLFGLSGLALMAAPFVALAQTGQAPTVCNATVSNIADFLCQVSRILNILLPVLIILGVVYFVWGVITYVVGGDAEKKEEGRSRMIYGIIGLVVIIGLWGLVRIVANTFNLQNQTTITVPTVPF